MSATTTKSTPQSSVFSRLAHSAIDAYKRTTALTEVVMVWPPEENRPTWVDTIDGPRLRGRNLPAMGHAAR